MFLIHSKISATMFFCICQGKVLAPSPQSVKTSGSIFKAFTIDLYTARSFHTILLIRMMIKLELQAAQAAVCALHNKNAVNAHVPFTFSVSTAFRPHPKRMTVSTSQLLGNTSEVWTFPRTLALKPHLGACPQNKAPIVPAPGRSALLRGSVATATQGCCRRKNLCPQRPSVNRGKEQF